MIDTKPCPYRVCGDRRTYCDGIVYYEEHFAPCMGEDCPCFHYDNGDPYCDRGGAYMKLGKKEADR